ncbi:hypothetical protein DBV39_08080 [Orrella marina]|uniref:Uncharacterized protein n=1 Tax=Orrella marina TaxID=2163011 RepID=A0A2R4XIV0_9BURK|nr:hypothetical protein DBV39_08080 [Orrella marina]
MSGYRAIQVSPGSEIVSCWQNYPAKTVGGSGCGRASGECDALLWIMGQKRHQRRPQVIIAGSSVCHQTRIAQL